MARGKNKNVRRMNRAMKAGKKTPMRMCDTNIQTNGRKHKKNQFKQSDDNYIFTDITYQGKVYRVEYTVDESIGRLIIRTVADINMASRTNNLMIKLNSIITDDNIINAVGQLLMDKLNNQ